jgi:hypothetical protein
MRGPCRHGTTPNVATRPCRSAATMANRFTAAKWSA